MTPWHPIETLPYAPAFCDLLLEDGQIIRDRPDGFRLPPPAPPAFWRPAPACAACGVPAGQARLGQAGSEYWPERRAELTCDACAERLTLAAERFRRARGWAALQERLSNAWPIPGAHFLASDLARRQEFHRRVAEMGARVFWPANEAGLEATRREEARRAEKKNSRTDYR